MKTFPEYFQDSIDLTDGSVTIWEKDYKAIQLDAMKEGMRRSAGICASRETDSDFTVEATRCRQKISDAAEQLTEKDL